MTANVIALLPRPKGKPAIQDGRQCLRLFPRWSNTLFWVYAIGFKGGVTKLGMTGKPRLRITQHWRATRGEVEWVRLFVPGSRFYARTVEERAIQAARKIGRRINTSEWFYDLSKADAIACVHAAEPDARLRTEAYEAERRVHEARRQHQLRAVA